MNSLPSNFLFLSVLEQNGTLQLFVHSTRTQDMKSVHTTRMTSKNVIRFIMTLVICFLIYWKILCNVMRHCDKLKSGLNDGRS